MKKIIEFNLPEDNEDFEICNNAPKMSSFIYDMENAYRDVLKYDNVQSIKDHLNIKKESRYLNNLIYKITEYWRTKHFELKEENDL